jgi:hypothetical protein
MGKSMTDESPLSPHRAFVVQLREQADVEQGRWAGRVEHVTWGRATHFQSLGELLAFVVRVLGTTPGRAPNE